MRKLILLVLGSLLLTCAYAERAVAAQTGAGVQRISAESPEFRKLARARYRLFRAVVDAGDIIAFSVEGPAQLIFPVGDSSHVVASSNAFCKGESVACYRLVGKTAVREWIFWVEPGANWHLTGTLKQCFENVEPVGTVSLRILAKLRTRKPWVFYQYSVAGLIHELLDADGSSRYDDILPRDEDAWTDKYHMLAIGPLEAKLIRCAKAKN